MDNGKKGRRLGAVYGTAVTGNLISESGKTIMCRVLECT